MTARCSPTETSHSYFVLMIDYGTDTSKAHGLEAVVQPEQTRRNIVELIKGDKFEGRRIAFIHHVEDGLVEDVTGDLLDEAEMELRAEASERRICAAEDRWHARRDAMMTGDV